VSGGEPTLNFKL